MNDELMGFMDDSTKSDRGLSSTSKKVSELYAHSRRMKCIMVCAILANMDPSVTFMQTLIGLACYAQGLRDKGMKLLNTLGVTASVFHIRQHGSWWAKIRKAINEVSPKAFWRVTFDNLDFKMKFAKKFQVVVVN